MNGKYVDEAITALEQPTAEDCVSRKDVIDIVNRQCVNFQDGTEIWRSYVNDTVEEIVDRVRELPSVSPTRQHGIWTTKSCSMNMICSCCGKETWYSGRNDYNFCPNCGADMREGNENESNNT